MGRGTAATTTLRNGDVLGSTKGLDDPGHVFVLAGPELVHPHEKLSPGQSAGIDRLYATYPELHDDDFVAANLERWRN